MLGSWQRVDAECMTKGVILPCKWWMLRGPQLCAEGGSGGLLKLSQLVRHWCWQLVGLFFLQLVFCNQNVRSGCVIVHLQYSSVGLGGVPGYRTLQYWHGASTRPQNVIQKWCSMKYFR